MIFVMSKFFPNMLSRNEEQAKLNFYFVDCVFPGVVDVAVLWMNLPERETTATSLKGNSYNCAGLN
jgi:hypothetical protein